MPPETSLLASDAARVFVEAPERQDEILHLAKEQRSFRNLFLQTLPAVYLNKLPSCKQDQLLEMISKTNRGTRYQLGHGFAIAFPFFNEGLREKVLDVARRARGFSHGFFEKSDLSFFSVINRLVPPEEYHGRKLRMGGAIRRLTLINASYIETEMRTRKFGYLAKTLRSGLQAHRSGSYLSTYAFFSVIDGMLTWWVGQSEKKGRPSFSEKIEEFLKTYQFDAFLDSERMKDKFRLFMQYRHNIVHGGEHAHVDENISTLAMLFLGIVYHSITSQLLR